MAEINTCRAEAMLALLERGEPSLARPRRAPDRAVGCCRDSTLLFLALARHKGFAARARVGFAAYFQPGWLLDHDWLDLTDDQFVTGPRAWRAARAGEADPARYVVAPGLDVPALRGWPYLAHNVLHDLAALGKTEMLLWDGWGLQMEYGPARCPSPSRPSSTRSARLRSTRRSRPASCPRSPVATACGSRRRSPASTRTAARPRGRT
jgi:hypothetical protein